MRASDMAPSKWLKASDLFDDDGDAQDVVVTIKKIDEESIGQGGQADDKWVMYFREKDKGLVLNKTNITTLSKLLGDETDDWIGKKITLFSTEVDFQGKQVPAIRIRSKLPKVKAGKEKAAAPAAAEPGDDDPDAEGGPPY